jgi:hypothetical protein
LLASENGCPQPELKSKQKGTQMSSRLMGYVLAGIGIVTASLCLISPAQANESFGFDLTFSDGSTAIGHGMIDPISPLDFIASYDVQTSGTSGFLYETGLGLPNARFSDGNLFLTFNRPGYDGFLVLEFNSPINGNGGYTLDLAGSFECIGGFQSANVTDDTCSHGTKRSVVSADGDAAQLVVPEPASLALLVTGLLVAFGGFIRRRRSVSRAA